MADERGLRDDLGVVISAGVVVLAARYRLSLPGWGNSAAVAAFLLASVVFHLASGRSAANLGTRVLFVLALALLAGGHATRTVAALREPLPERVDGVGRLVGDPVVRIFDVQAVIDVDGRRYQASVPLGDSAAVRPLLTGENVVVTGRPSLFEDAPMGWILSTHLAGRLKVAEIQPGPVAPPWYRVANSLRRVIERGSQSLGSDRSSLYMGLVVGDDRGQSALTKFRFQASGLTHLLAVSGQNVAFLVAAVEPVLRRFGPRSKLLAIAVVLLMFTLVTRGEPSVLRAVVMAGLAIVAVIHGREASGVRILSLTVITLVIVDPMLVHSIGFRLSVLATSGLLLLARPIQERLPGPDFVRLPLAVTLSAQVATAPLILGLAGGIPVAATPANLLAVPVSGLVMMFGVTGGVVAGFLRESVAGVLMWPAGQMVGWINWVAESFSRTPLGVLGPSELAMAGIAVALILERPRGRWQTPVAAVGMVCLLLVFWPRPLSAGSVEVAEGATLWSSECGGRVLVLSRTTNEKRVMEGIWKLDVRSIDAAVVDGGGSLNRVVSPISEQFGIRSLLSTDETATLATLGLVDGPVQVGGLTVRLSEGRQGGRTGPTGAASVLIEGVGGECKF